MHIRPIKREINAHELNWDLKLNMHLDYDKHDDLFYNNIYFTDLKIVIKMPVSQKGEIINGITQIENFDLTKYVFLIHY